MIKTLPISILLILLLLSATFGQEKTIPKSKPILLLDKYAFYDEKSGIQKLVVAENKARYQGFIVEKDENKRLENYKTTYEKRRKIFVEPILKEISAILKQIEIQNNIIIIDGIELEENNQLLAFSGKLDFSKKITQVVSDYFINRKLKKLNLDLSVSKVAVIDASLLNEISERESNLNSTNEQNLSQILNYRKQIQEFANKNGFDLILDSSKKIPDELKIFPIQDVTNDFISYFKQTNP